MNTYVVLGIIVALAGLIAWSRRTGATVEREKQAEAELKAIDIADQVQNDVGAIPPDKRRSELKEW